MARRISRKELKRDEFIEATVDAGQWLERNWPMLAKVAASVLLVVLVGAAWLWNVNRNRARAGELLAEGMRVYGQAEEAGFVEQTELARALESFDAAIAKAGGTRTGEVARYYRGASLYRLGRLDEAEAALQGVGSGGEVPSTLVGSARALLARVLAAEGETQRAIEILQALADADPPSYPPDQALLALADLYEAQGDVGAARRALQRIVDEFPARESAERARGLLDR